MSIKILASICDAHRRVVIIDRKEKRSQQRKEQTRSRKDSSTQHKYINRNKKVNFVVNDHKCNEPGQHNSPPYRNRIASIRKNTLRPRFNQ